MIPIITDSAGFSTPENSQTENSTIELDKISDRSLSSEWIDNLSPEAQKAVIQRFCRIIESKPTLCESFALNQALYRTISGNSFTESASRAAQRTGCDRKTILKGLAQAVEQNILSENKRPGTSNEYFFKPIEEWKPEPVVHKKDTPKVIRFPSTENPGTQVETVPDQNLDDPNLDPNNVIVVNKILNKQQEQVSIPITAGNTIWRSLPDGNRYAQVPPIYDQAVGVEIQRQMDESGLTAQSIVGRAIALSKVPLMLLELWTTIDAVRLSNLLVEAGLENSETREAQEETTHSGSKSPIEVVVSLQLSKTLSTIGVNLSERQLYKCVTQYGEDVMLAAANKLKKTGTLANKENPTGYFLGCLKNGMGQKSATVQLCEPEDESEKIKPNDAASEIALTLTKPVKSFSHMEISPRIAVANLILDGQYQRAAILAGLYKIDYEELVTDMRVGG
ncbi:MAG: hypothetical protein PUP93_10285 [Rhizonema sp. NSF051]|nr:hypothetical protein [Rhizonema sp. NSF051]